MADALGKLGVLSLDNHEQVENGGVLQVMPYIRWNSSDPSPSCLLLRAAAAGAAGAADVPPHCGGLPETLCLR